MRDQVRRTISENLEGNRRGPDRAWTEVRLRGVCSLGVTNKVGDPGGNHTSCRYILVFRAAVPQMSELTDAHSLGFLLW